MSMLEYYSFVVKTALFILIGLVFVGGVCAIGWLLCDRELKKEIIRTRLFKAESGRFKRALNDTMARNNFLSNRVYELQEEIALEKERADKLMFEKVSLEDRLHKALAAVRVSVESEGGLTQAQSTSGVTEKVDCHTTIRAKGDANNG